MTIAGAAALIIAGLTRSARAEREGIDNTPSPDDAARLLWLATREAAALAIVRSEFPAAYRSSAYRSDALNAATPGASPTSYHSHGLAFDLGGLGSFANVLAAARLLASRASELDGIRTIIAEQRSGLHVHADFFDPFGTIKSSRTSAAFLEELPAGSSSQYRSL